MIDVLVGDDRRGFGILAALGIEGIPGPCRCLELPVSAPDDVQPLVQRDDLRQLRRMVGAKVAFVQDTGGLFVGTLHGGVFGPRDAALCGAHLSFVARQVARSDAWLATLSVERQGESITMLVPALDPGGSVALALLSTARPAADPRVLEAS